MRQFLLSASTAVLIGGVAPVMSAPSTPICGDAAGGALLPRAYIAVRRLEARTERSGKHGWMDVRTTLTDGQFAYEVRDLNVTTHGELAFVHSLNHVSGTRASGQITDMWLRWTACFRRIDGVWLVVHDHVSVPADFEHGKAALNLKP